MVNYRANNCLIGIFSKANFLSGFASQASGGKKCAMEIGEVIKALRVERNWTQEKLALDVEVATSTMSRIEIGRRKPSEALLKRLAAALGTTVADLYARVEGRKAKANGPAALSGAEAMDYLSEAINVRRLFRELTPQNQKLAVEMLRVLKRMQS